MMVVRVDLGTTSRGIRQNDDSIPLESELPRLGVMAGCGECRAAHEARGVDSGSSQLVSVPDLECRAVAHAAYDCKHRTVAAPRAGPLETDSARRFCVRRASRAPLAQDEAVVGRREPRFTHCDAEARAPLRTTRALGLPLTRLRSRPRGGCPRSCTRSSRR